MEKRECFRRVSERDRSLAGRIEGPEYIYEERDDWQMCWVMLGNIETSPGCQ